MPDGDARKREGHRSSGAGRHAAEAADEAATTVSKVISIFALSACEKQRQNILQLNCAVRSHMKSAASD